MISLYENLSTYSLFQLLLMIGEAFDEHSNEICGAVVNRRSKADKIGVWTADVEKATSVMEIG